MLFMTILINNPIAFAEDIKIIANKNVPVDTLTASEIKRLFDGKLKMWKNGDMVVLTQYKNEIVQKTFLKKYIKKMDCIYS